MMFKKQIIKTNQGEYVAFWTEKGLFALAFPGESNQYLQNYKILAKENFCESGVFNRELLFSLEENLIRYFLGEKIEYWDLPLDLSIYTDFQIKVLKETQKIKYGKTITYKDLAISIKHDKAVRAVGNALHVNRLPIIIPCHRVIGSNGKLVGFAGGLVLKKFLLNMEREKNEINC